MMDAKLIQKSPLAPRLFVSNYTGEGGRTYKRQPKQRLSKDLLNRIRMALFGGVVVVAPMLIMTLAAYDVTVRAGGRSAWCWRGRWIVRNRKTF